MTTTKQNLGNSRYSSESTFAEDGEALVLTLDSEVTAKLLSGKSEHKTVKLPVGSYDLAWSTSGIEYAGSDYCWYTTYVNVFVHATNGDKKRVYEVRVKQGGDSQKFEHGKITIEKR
jgi:hypothetical protein